MADIVFHQDRLGFFTDCSRDVYSDSISLADWLVRGPLTELRANLENAIINGVPGGIGPQGLINSSATAVASKSGASSKSINAAAIDLAYATLSDAAVENLVWIASRSCIERD